MSTETFESFNGVFRHCSILSNHHAPSRDIARKIADLDRFKHIASGGKWLDGDKWVGPGNDLVAFMQKHELLQNSLGWTNAKNKIGMSAVQPSHRITLLIYWYRSGKCTDGRRAVPEISQVFQYTLAQCHSSLYRCLLSRLV